MRDIHSIDDLRRRAKRRLPAMVYDFIEGGALDELTLRRNREALEAQLLPQRVLVDTSQRHATASILGTRLDLPLVVSPMGLLTVCHPDADVAIARAAATSGSVFVHSPWSGCSLEEVTDAAPGRVWAQIAFWNDSSETERHIDRAQALGVETLVVAGDVAVSSKRDRDLRHGSGMPPRPPLRDVVDTALHPGWVLRWLLGRRITWGTYRIDGRAIRMSEMGAWMDRNTNQAASWDDIARLRSRWKGNLVVKGVMTQADARLAIDHGIDGVFVSNHGGRQFDGQLATIEALPSVVDAVDGRAAVIMDGGIRRGSDIAKALSLGADAAAAGRPFALGLAAAGRPGVERAFDVLHDELLTVMGFLGVTRIEGLPESLCASHDLSDGIEVAR